MRLARAVPLLAAASLLAAVPARAQGPRGELSAPGEGITPTAPGPDDAAVADVDVPAPPGASDEVPDVRYPVPSSDDEADEEPAIRISSRVTTRLRALDANLRALSANGGGNIVNAVLSMITGGLAITLGALRDTPTDFMSIYLYVYGGAAAVRGVLDLVLTPNASDAAITYQHMPMTTHEEVRERLEYGEAQLRGLAEQAMIGRILDASINMAAGVAVVPIYLAPNNFEISSPLDYFILIGAGVSILSGVITLASSSSEEQRWNAYRELRDRLEEEHVEDGQAEDVDEPVAAAPDLRWRLSAGSFSMSF